MIQLNHPASLRCDEPGCDASQPAMLVLLASGGFGAVPQNPKWQLGKLPGGAFVTRCPEHIAPVIPSVVP